MLNPLLREKGIKLCWAKWARPAPNTAPTANFAFTPTAPKSGETVTGTWQMEALPDRPSPAPRTLRGSVQSSIGKERKMPLLYVYVVADRQVHGAPVSLFILGGTGLGSVTPRQLEAAGHKAILWTSGADTYVLIGRTELAETAAWMRAELQRRKTED